MQSKAPFFSVIIPLYNKEKDIQQTLESLFMQSFEDFEVLVVNDGSTDTSLALVDSIKEPRLKVFSKDNEGVARTRNFGVAKATSEHVVFLDADDYWHADHLQNLHHVITQYPSHLWYATAYEKQHHSRLITPMQSPILKKDPHWKGSIENYFKWSLQDPLAWTSAVCMKTSFFTSLNGFDASITMGAGEDTDLWLRAALQAPLAFSRKITARHRLDSSNRLSKISALQRKYMDLDQYESLTQEIPFLKQYLDSNRYGIALHHKLAGDIATFQRLKEKIAPTSLNAKQKKLLNMSRFSLRFLKKMKAILHQLGFRPSSF